MKKVSDIAPEVLKKVREGVAIPAQVLALDENRRFAPRYQRALTRYFIDCGVGGIAVGVHSTQFAIRDPKVGLFKPVLSETSRFIDEWCEKQGKKILKVGGVCGRTEQAVAEAEFEAANGYDAALLSLAAMKDDSIEAMLEHCKAVMNSGVNSPRSKTFLPSRWRLSTVTAPLTWCVPWLNPAEMISPSTPETMTICFLIC